MTSRLRGIGSVDQGAVRTPRVNYADLGMIEVPVPPIPEQERVSDRLRQTNQQTSRVRDVLRSQLNLLADHRQALITAAVTGEITVPGAA